MLTKNYTDTPVEGVASLTLPRAVLNFKDDFRKIVDEPSEVRITNLNSPIDAPETFRLGRSNVANVYNGFDVAPSKKAASGAGISIVCQLTNSVTDVVDGIETVLPVSTHVVFKFPKHSAITADLLIEELGRMTSGLFATGSSAPTRLEGIMRGSLLPSDI